RPEFAHSPLVTAFPSGTFNGGSGQQHGYILLDASDRLRDIGEHGGPPVGMNCLHTIILTGWSTALQIADASGVICRFPHALQLKLMAFEPARIFLGTANGGSSEQRQIAQIRREGVLTKGRTLRHPLSYDAQVLII